MITFGPVPSRRLGQSLGINNIPPKICSYSCVYCQVGRTNRLQVERRVFFDPHFLFKEVEDRVKKMKEDGRTVDYLTFVPDGEPTLDIFLGREIELLKGLGIKIAVITNSSLIWRADVRKDLIHADWVSAKVDTVDEKVWKKLNRPHGSLSLNAILNGLIQFAREFRGELVTETLLVDGINDRKPDAKNLADFLGRLNPQTAYISIPTRPPAEKWVGPPDENIINRTYQMIGQKVERVELITGYEGNNFVHTGNAEEDLLNITAVHPMRQEAVRHFLSNANLDWAVVQKLITERYLTVVEYRGEKFFIRRFSEKNRKQQENKLNGFPAEPISKSSEEPFKP